MSYFNKKEEVLEVILTSYGKYKLSRGEWSPKYYAFYDEDVTYDSRYMAGNAHAEPSGSAEARIQEQTPALKLQTNKTDLEKKLQSIQSRTNQLSRRGIQQYRIQEQFGNFILNSDARLSPYILPLGNSTLRTTAQTYAPAWHIVALKNEFSSSSTVQSASYENITQIPQLGSDITYTTQIYTTADIDGAYSSAETVENELTHMQEQGSISLPSDGFLVTYFDDDSLIVIDDGYLVLQVEEANSARAVDQFSIRVWEVESDITMQPKDQTGQKLRPLKFIDYPQEIVNDILLDPAEIPKVDPTLIDEGYVEYFMDIMVDEEIDDLFFPK